MSEQGNDPTAEMAIGPSVSTGPGGATAPGSTVPPPYGARPLGAPAPELRRLVRDPDARLGGVSAGLAHYLGIDVSLVRLAFVLTTVFSGFGLVVYILAWLVLPKAEQWPPPGGSQPLHSVSPRQVAVGLGLLVLLVALFVNGGGLVETVVPLLLIAAGIWVLRQPEAGRPGTPDPTVPMTTTPMPSTTPTSTMSATTTMNPVARGPFSAPDAPQPTDTSIDPTSAWSTGGPPPRVPDPTWPAPTPPPPTGSHAPGTGLVGAAPDAAAPEATATPRRRRRRRFRGLLFFLLFLFVLLPLLVVALVIGLLIGGVVDIGSGFSATYRPQTALELPSTIDHDAGDIELDLTQLDISTLDPDRPVPIDIELDFGEVRVLVPEDFPIDVDAEADVGEVTVFNERSDGFDLDVSSSDEDAVLDLEVRLGFGEVQIERVD